MTRISVKNIPLLAKRFALIPVALMLVSTSVHAQAPDTAKMAKAMARYKNENAVYTSYNKKLEIKYEDGELVATSNTKTERVLIGDLSPANDHYDNITDDSYYGQLTHLDAVAYIPQKGGNYKTQTRHNAFRVGAGEGVITDASAIVTSFTGLTKGSVIRVVASQDHNDISVIPLTFFESNYPIMHAEYEVDVPSFVNVKFVLKGENTDLFKQTKEERNGVTIYKFVGENIPAYRKFEHVPSGLYYIPHVVTYISSFRLPGQAQDSMLMSDPEHMYKKMFKFVGYMNVKQDTAIKNLVNRLTKGDVTDRQKAMHLYEWVQKNMHYVGFEIGLGGQIPREADTVYKKMYGDCKDMSSLLVQMGRMAGLKTYFTWIGTTEKPYTFEETPTLSACNHMICALNLDGKWMFMDGTHANLPFGANRDDIQGKQALIAIDKDHYKIETIPTLSAENNVTIDTTFIRISEINDNDILGHFKMKMTGYAAWNLGYSLLSLTREKEEREKVVKAIAMRGSDKFILDNYKIKEKEDKDIIVSGDFNVGGYVHHLKKDVIVNMNLLHHFEDNHIDTAFRKVAWYHNYKNIQKEVVVMDIPKDYKVTYLPKNASGKLDDMWSYSITYKIEGKKIILTKEYKLNTLTISPKYFIDNNKAIEALEKQYRESVVLTAK